VEPFGQDKNSRKLMNKPINQRLKTWLFRVFLLAALLGPVVIGAFNHIIDSQFSTETLGSGQIIPTEVPQTVCIPSVDQAAYDQLDALTLGQETDLAISLRMAALFSADQAARQLPVSDPQELNAEDAARRVEVLDYVLNGQIHSARDLVYAAYIFQHGDCSEHYQFANRLAKIALDTGYADARWIYAASLDRYLMSIGQPQKFGTQYTWVDGEYQLYPVDPTTSDVEREQYDIPPLRQNPDTKPAGMSAGNIASARHWLESWWLTLIGAAFAVLGAVISLVEAEPNPFLGKVVLVMTLMIYALSAFGHYAQVNALAGGNFEAQAKVWGAVNTRMLVVWFVVAGIGAIRWVRIRSTSHNK
jgi:hypothetical protein